MRRDYIDFQVFLEIGHVLSNMHKLRVTSHTAAPGASVNGAQHHVVLSMGCGGKSRGDDDLLQFGLMDDEASRRAHRAGSSCSHRDESRALALPDMND